MRPADKVRNDSSRQDWCILAAGFIFAITFQKFVTRDGLSKSVGFQGMMEVGLTLLSCLIIFLLSRGRSRRIGCHLSVVCFWMYGMFALASSVDSFDVKLSITKACIYLLVLLMAYVVSEMEQAVTFLTGVYWSYVAALFVGLGIGVVWPQTHPLFNIDTYNGRTRLNLFATHPNSIGEVSGLLFLLAMVLPIRTRWYWQAFLLGVNILAGEKTATTAVILSAGLMYLFGRRHSPRKWVTAFAIAGVGCAGLILISFGVVQASHGKFAVRVLESIYGTQVSNEVSGFDGRSDVWKQGAKLADECVVLGFGLEGARASLQSAVGWSGHAHNGFLQALLSTGLLGLLALLIGWFEAVRGALVGDDMWRVHLLSLNIYLFFLAMIGEVFDSPSYFTVMVIVILLYVGLQRSTSRRSSALRSRGMVSDLSSPIACEN